MDHMKSICEKMLDKTNDLDMINLINMMNYNISGIQSATKDIEKYIGEAYQRGDDIYNAVDAIKCAVDEPVAVIDVENWFTQYVRKGDEKFKTTVKKNCKERQAKMASAFPTLGSLFEVYKNVPAEFHLLIIENCVTADNWLIESDGSDCVYTGVREEYKDIKILWE